MYCFDFDEEAFVRDWLAGVTDTGRVILTDEEIQPLHAYLVGAGFAVAPRAAARGTRLRQIIRVR